MVGFTPRAGAFPVVGQPRRFVAQNDKEIEGLGCLLGACPEFAWNLHGTRSSLGICSEFTRKRPGPAMRGTLQFAVFLPFAPWSSCLAVSNRCPTHMCFSIRMSSSLPKCLIWMVASVVKNPTMVRVTLCCVDGSSVSGPSGGCLTKAKGKYF